MNISKAIPGSITIEYQDEEWTQTIDYEHIPFKCQKCHEHGHLFRDFPLNALAQPTAEEKQQDGFTQVKGCRKQTSKKSTQTGSKKIPTNNSFDALNNLSDKEEVENPHKTSKPRKGKGKAKQTLDPVLEKIRSHDPQAHTTLGKDLYDDDDDIIMQIDERELEDIDRDKLEEALNRKEIQSILVEQLRKVHKVFIDSTTGATSRLGIHLELDLDPSETRKKARDV
jgi:hypothetical protein